MTKYTIFYEHGHSYSGVTIAASSIQAAIHEYVVERGYGRPVAWSTESTLSHGGTRTTKDVRMDAIAAGRSITYEAVSGKYVPRGVAVESKTTSGFEEFLKADYVEPWERVANRHVVQVYAEPERPALTWNQPTKTDRWDGFTVKKGSISQPTPQSKFTSPDLKEASHQVSPGFGSAYIGKA